LQAVHFALQPRRLSQHLFCPVPRRDVLDHLDRGDDLAAGAPPVNGSTPMIDRPEAYPTRFVAGDLLLSSFAVDDEPVAL